MQNSFQKAWQALLEQQKKIAPLHMRDMFKEDTERFKKFSLSNSDIFLDFSKNRIDSKTIDLLCQLADAAQLSEKIAQLFQGHPLNSSEHRPALHAALRQQNNEPILVNGKNLTPEIRATQKKLYELTNAILQKQWLGYTNEVITDIVNIGIGGSHLGPALAISALEPYAVSSLHFHFVSNLDAPQMNEMTKKLKPQNTLFIISSKNFTTQETLANANFFRRWFQQVTNNDANALRRHFFAITCKPERALQFGIDAKNILQMWDWVGGRFSLWSTIGLPILLKIGVENFQQMLAGACAMDQHFRNAPFAQNMPVILALLSIWYVNFFGARAQAILPYDPQLQYLPAYLQQAHMESHGKHVRHNGEPVEYATGPVVWGSIGTHGQHAFHQLLHQGTQLIPADFIITLQHDNDWNEYHEILFANCLSQSKALMTGKTVEELIAELTKTGLLTTQIQLLASHKTIPGNRPSNTLLLSQLTPYSFGALIALYEHKIFTQSVIWDINCFDQWGVELGKQLATHIFQDLQNAEISSQHDASTIGLMQRYLNKSKK